MNECMRGARNSAQHCVAQTLHIHYTHTHTHSTATFHSNYHVLGLPLCGAHSADVRGLLHHSHPVLDGMPDLFRGVGGRGHSGRAFDGDDWSTLRGYDGQLSFT